MSTNIRPETSEHSEYWINKHRFYELKHFCLQYSLWKRYYADINITSRHSSDITVKKNQSSPSKYVENCAVARAFYSSRMEMIEKIALETDMIIGEYIFKAVTEGYSYEYLKAKLDIPCCRGTYYSLYRKFFWLLDKARQ